MKIKYYEVSVDIVTYDTGRFIREEVVGRADTEEKAIKIAKRFQKENEVNQFWCHYGTHKENDVTHITMYIEEKTMKIE